MQKTRRTNKLSAIAIAAPKKKKPKKKKEASMTGSHLIRKANQCTALAVEYMLCLVTGLSRTRQQHKNASRKKKKRMVNKMNTKELIEAYEYKFAAATDKIVSGDLTDAGEDRVYDEIQLFEATILALKQKAAVEE